MGGNVFSSLEPGYRHRTSAAIHVENGHVVDMGNAYEGGSVSGLTNGKASSCRVSAGQPGRDGPWSADVTATPQES